MNELSSFSKGAKKASNIQLIDFDYFRFCETHFDIVFTATFVSFLKTLTHAAPLVQGLFWAEFWVNQ